MLTRSITRTSLLLALALTVQQVKIQWLTGPAINAILILAVAYVGVHSAVLIASVTPILALMNGIMPLAIVVPFIILGNILYVLMFNWQYGKNNIAGVALASILKYLALMLSVKFIIEVPEKVAFALSTPQLITALSGGVMAIVIIKYLPLEKAIKSE